MESGRSVLARASSCSRASMEVSSADLEDREVAGSEPPNPWTGEKKSKIQSTHTTPGDLSNAAPDDTERSSGEIVDRQEQDEIEGLNWDDKKLRKENAARDDTELSSGEIVYEIEEQDEIEEKVEEQDEIEVLNWNDAKLRKKIESLRTWMHDMSLDEDYAYAHDDERWVEFNEEEQRKLNRRLALCRIRAHEKQYQGLDDASLLRLFPHEVLERNRYYVRYENHFDWFFDPLYCKFARVEDYQRMVLRATVDFADLEIRPDDRNTLEDDQQFVQFWETLSRNATLIELYIKGTSCDERQRIENVLLYHALKIAEKLPSVYKTPILARFREFMCGLKTDYTYAGFLTKMWALLAKKKMNFTDALRCVYNEGKYLSIFRWGTEFEQNLSPIERFYKPHLDRFVKEARDSDVHQLVMDTIVENVWKPRTYYDYVRKKMRIAEEIRLIPKQPPHMLYTPGRYL